MTKKGINYKILQNVISNKLVTYLDSGLSAMIRINPRPRDGSGDGGSWVMLTEMPNVIFFQIFYQRMRQKIYFIISIL